MSEKIGCILVLPLPGKRYLGIDCSKGRGVILPGGKVDEGETWQECAAREAKEEVGAVVHPDNCRYLWHGPDGDGFTTFAFLCTSNFNVIADHRSSEGRPTETTYQELLKSKFGNYYRILFEVSNLPK